MPPLEPVSRPVFRMLKDMFCNQQKAPSLYCVLKLSSRLPPWAAWGRLGELFVWCPWDSLLLFIFLSLLWTRFAQLFVVCLCLSIKMES